MVRKCAHKENQELVEYLEAKVAQEQQRVNAGKTAFAYKNAIKSVAAHPVPLMEEKEFLKLKGVGTKIASMLLCVRKKSSKTTATGPVSAPRAIAKKPRVNASAEEVLLKLVSLGKPTPFLNLVLGQEDVPSIEKSCSILETNGLIQRTLDALGIEKYDVTAAGKERAAQAVRSSCSPSRADSRGEKGSVPKKRKVPEILSYQSRSTSMASSAALHSSSKTSDAIYVSESDGEECCNTLPLFSENYGQPERSYEGSKWDLILLCDCRETHSQRGRNDLETCLLGKGVSVEQRALPLGDFLFVFREKSEYGRKSRELVSDVIIERKNADDLIASIKDGRYREQKCRLEHCGLNKVIYLLEGGLSKTKNDKWSKESLEMAISKTQVRDGFKLRQTENFSDTIQFLANLFFILSPSAESLEPTTLMTYEDFVLKVKKQNPRTVAQIFAAQVKEIKGCSSMKALAIVERYPTPIALYRGLHEAPVLGRQSHFEDVLPEGHRKRLGKTVSARIVETFTA